MKRTILDVLHVTLLGVSLAGLTACSSGEGPPASEPEPGTTGAAVFACVEDDFITSGPFQGPGYDPEQGGLLGPAQETYIAATTIGRIKPAALEDHYQGLVVAVIEQLATQEGLIGLELGQSEKCGYTRTKTVWRDEEAMFGFVGSDAHVAAMAEGRNVLSAAAVAHWTVGADEVPPSWTTVHDKIAATEVSHGEPE